MKEERTVRCRDAIRKREKSFRFGGLQPEQSIFSCRKRERHIRPASTGISASGALCLCMRRVSAFDCWNGDGLCNRNIFTGRLH